MGRKSKAQIAAEQANEDTGEQDFDVVSFIEEFKKEQAATKAEYEGMLTTQSEGMEELQRQIAEAKGEAAQANERLNAKEGAAKQSDDRPEVTDEMVHDLLDNPIPKTWFFNYLPRGMNCLYIDKRVRNLKTSTDLQDHYDNQPELWMTYQRWRGPLSEMDNPNYTEAVSSTQRIVQIGFCDIARNERVHITPEDIKKYDIDPDAIPMKRNPFFTLTQVMERIEGLPDYISGKILDGPTFKLRVKAHYAGVFARRKEEKILHEKMDEIQSGREKLARQAMVGV